MKHGIVLYLASQIGRFLDRRVWGGCGAPSGFEDGDRQTALEYELSFWRAAAPVWY